MRRLILLFACLITSIQASSPIILSYFPSYTNLSPARDRLPYDKVTHFCWAFSSVDSAGNMTFKNKEAIDEFIDSVTAHGNTPLLSIGGCSTIDDFKVIMQSPQTLSDYCDTLINFCKLKGFQGVEVNWEGDNLRDWKNKFELHWPNFKDAYRDFVIHLGQKLHAEGMTIGVDVYATEYFGQYYPDGSHSLYMETVDRMLIMTGGEHGAWDLNYPWTAVARHHGNMDFVQENINYWVNRQVPIEKIIPSYVGSFLGYNIKGASAIGNRYDTLGSHCDQWGNVRYTTIDSLIKADAMYRFGGGAEGSALYYAGEPGESDDEIIFYNSFEDFRYMSYTFLQQGILGAGYWNVEIDLPTENENSLIEAITQGFSSEVEIEEPPYIPFDPIPVALKSGNIKENNTIAVVGRSLFLNSGSEKFNRVSLHSPSGRVLWREDLESSTGSITVDLPGTISAGVYLLQISGEFSSLQRRVVLK